MINFFKKLIAFFREKYNQFFFVGSTDILPPPLEKEEELAYLIKAQKGDLEARNKLIEHNLRLVVFISKRFENKGDSLEDLVSIGTIGLIKGINTYKIDKNIRLATYASRCISNEILMYIRKNKKRNGDISLEEALTFDGEGNELHLEDVVGTPEDVVYKEYEKKVDINILRDNINALNERDKQIMVMRYGLFNTNSYTQKEVAELLGISQSYISRIEKKVIKSLKPYLDS
ncbi:MAG: RNA polymerase sporulation sigma factor SigK [Bacilli bacterium]|nr:RNA polymerase sporulation sigma factor SigK [Bacilli bacterium]